MRSLTEAGSDETATIRQRKEIKTLLYHTGFCKTATFVVFINDRQLMHFSYTRYLENQIRNTFGFRGTPIHIIARERKER